MQTNPTAPAPPPSPGSPQPAGEYEYILGTGEDEIGRLGLQHRVWGEVAHRLWEMAGIGPGMTVLDVGCGPGHATMDLAELVGASGRVLAVDESAFFLKHLNNRVRGRNLSNVERILGDVQRLGEVLPQVEGVVDVAWARWVLCYVSEPEQVVAAVARAMKPGGRFVIQDYFNYEAMTLAPRQEAFSRVVHSVAASWRARGGDPDIAGRLPGMLRRHGFAVEHVDVSQRLARSGSTAWAWPETFWKSFLPRLVSLGHLSEEDVAAFERTWAEAGDDPDAFVMLPPVIEIVAKKADTATL